MAITLHDSVVVEGRQWYLQKVDFSLDDKTFSTYFYALSREHASYMFEAIKSNGQLGDEIVATYNLNSAEALPVMTPVALLDVIAERQRQQSVEGFTPQRDDTYTACELAAAAISYIEPMMAESYWPADWLDDSFKPSDYRRNLVKAAALTLAEIERLDRAVGIRKQNNGS